MMEVVLNTTRTASDKTMVKTVVIPAGAIGIILEMAEAAVPTILDLTRVIMQETTLITARS